ncbi:MAG: response regulator [Verrucomicrobia bacterium]|nr:response regulator [Verrucomicrobiota bacterium]MCF7708065.1 response regulator [Verrucomicrobiota bacterium]
MDAGYDYKEFAILYVDDEEKSLRLFKKAFGKTFRILTAENAEEGYKILREHKDDIGILITDQRMPGEKGVQLLEKARKINPSILRILITAYSDLSTVIEAVNSGAIYKFISKPWEMPVFEQLLRRAMEFFIVQHERDELLRQKLKGIHYMMIKDRVFTMGVLASGLSHHVCNSLVAIRSFLDLTPIQLREDYMDLKKINESSFWNTFYKHAQNQISHITDLMEDLGLFSETHSNGFNDEIQLKDTIQSSIAAFQDTIDSKHLRIDLKIPDDLPQLHVDYSKFKQLFKLFFQDEFSFLEDNNRVSIYAKHSIDRKQNREYIDVFIEDNGPGIPEESLQSAFDPFFTEATKPYNCSIGLLLSYLLIHYHEGSIKYIDRTSQNPEQGTSFHLRFPVNPENRTVFEQKAFIEKLIMNEKMWKKLMAEV